MSGVICFPLLIDIPFISLILFYSYPLFYFCFEMLYLRFYILTSSFSFKKLKSFYFHILSTSIICKYIFFFSQDKYNILYFSVYSFTLLMPSIRSQTFHRVGYRCFYCLETYCCQCYNYCRKSTCSKYPPTDVDAINIILQPLVHYPPCKGCGD